MKRVLFYSILVISLLSCDKDSFETKPTLEYKSANTDIVPQNSDLRVTLDYTDKEGDLGNGVLTYIRVRTNSTPIPDPGTFDKIDTIRTAIPEFPQKNKGEIDILFDYNFLDEDPNRNDSMFFRITVTDLAGNASDTIATPIVVARQL